jgi:hypothetical protein
MKMVYVWLDATSEPVAHNAVNTYQKGDFFCVYCVNGLVYKYPVDHIFRVIEDYGIHATQIPVAPGSAQIQ